MPGEYMQTIKVAMVLAGCSFIGGSAWADWVYDYPVLTHQPDAIVAASDHYLRRTLAGEKHMYVPLGAVMLVAFGLSAGLALMEEHNLLFDGVCLLGILFGVSTYATSIAPGLKSLAETGLKSMTSSTDIDSLTETITKIAAAHIIILGVAAGVSLLQFIHFILIKKWAYDAKHKSVGATAASKKSQ